MMVFGLILAIGFAAVLVWRFRHDLRIPGAWVLEGLAAYVRSWLPGHAEPEPSPAAAAVAQYAATRAIPSVMEDPALGAPAEPADAVPSGVPVPAPWAALAQWIATREPENDQELRMFSDGDAVGALAVADAFHAFADTCLNGLRLSPAYVAGVLEAGDSVGGLASLFAQIYKRYLVVYGVVKEWMNIHGHLPHNGDFLTGSD